MLDELRGSEGPREAACVSGTDALPAAMEAMAAEPGGAPHLRELVLQFAVRGRLVPQRAGDEPAEALLARVEGHRTRLCAERVYRRQRPLPPPPGHGGGPHPIPASWAWSRVGALGAVGPVNEVPDDREASFVPMPAVPTDSRSPIRAERRPWGEIRRGYTHLAEGDVAVARITPCFQNRRSCVMRGLAGGIGAGTTELHVLRPVPGGVLPEYLLLFFKSPDFIAGGVAAFTGTAGQQRVPREYFAHRPVPIPPRPEQRRIVARVDELMALLDRLEAAETAREATRARCRDAALAALRDAGDRRRREAAWSRVADRAHVLLTDPADVPPLRETILELAMQGRLVAPEPGDTPASEWLGDRALAADTADLPPGWAWSDLGHLGEVIGGGTPSKSNSNYWSGAIPWVTPKDVKRDRIDSSRDQITPEGVAGSSARRIPAGALLMVVRGMILAHSFPTAILAREGTVNQDLKALVPFDPDLSPYLLLLSKGIKRRVLALVSRSTHGTCKLPTRELLSLPLPIPPPEEQARIVSRVGELLALADRLEETLVQARRTHAALCEAAVSSLSDPRGPG